MSQENVDAFLEHVEAVNRADVPGALRFMDPEVQFETQVSALQGSYTGHDGARAFYEDISGHFAVFQVHLSDVRDLGDQVLALGTARTTGKGSGIEQETPLAIVMTFRDGLITQFKDYGQKEQALEAAGIQE